ncbi:MAG TPA: SMP-30/gluconolactonase/LRE family protein [Polyangiaceae bacterium]|nr:SMP-30/gluconolactonase/LRE family protein [Polyangiaceae bacterium]
MSSGQRLRRVWSWIVAPWLLGGSFAFLGCSGEGPDAGPSFDGGPFGSAGSSAGSGSPEAGAGGQAGAAGAASGGSGGVREGNGGSLGWSGSGGASVAGSGGGGGAAPVGRVGAESCPAGPFGDPLPANPSIQKLASVGGNDNVNWEGLVWVGNALFFSEIAGNNSSQINRFVPGGSVQRGAFPNTGSNGLALDPSGDLLLAAHDVGGISRLDLPAGTLTRGAQTFNGMRFNSPNDLVLRADGNLYFTDPDFQSPSGRIQGDTRVYRIAPAQGGQPGAISVVDDSIDQPNGITLSPDGNTLYVTGGSVLRSYALDAAGVATPIKAFQQALQVPDGMAMDCAGNVYAVENSARRIRVFSADGTLLGTIGPQGFDNQGLTNVAFGGTNHTTLFVSSFTQGSQGGLYSVELNVPGLPY